MSILVLGGAGYIGSHAVDQLISKGYTVVVVDNLLIGHRSAVHEQATFYEGDIRDKAFLRSVFEKESIEGVLHFAANSLVGESVEKPLMYFNNNVHGTQIALEVMQEFGVKHIVFLPQRPLMANQKQCLLQKKPQRILKTRMGKVN